MRDRSIVRRCECCGIAVQQELTGVMRRPSVQSATKQNESAGPEPVVPKPSAAAGKKTKLSVLLITGDDTLWPQIGAHLSKDLILKQVDSVDELLTATQPGQAAILLWDARNQTDSAVVLSRLQLHSPRFAVIALDDAGRESAWTSPIALRQVVAQLPVPVLPEDLKTALESAHEEVNARVALLGESGDHTPAGAAPATPSGPRSVPWVPAAVIGGVLIAGAVAYMVLRHGNTSVGPAPSAAPRRPCEPGRRNRRPNPRREPMRKSMRSSRKRSRQCSNGTSSIRPTAAHRRCIRMRCFSIRPAARRAKACSGSRKSCSRRVPVRLGRAQNSTLRCNPWKPRAASIPATADWRRSTRVSRVCGLSSVRRRFWRPSPRKTSTVPRS